MKAICYKNTLTNLPGWVNTVHVEQVFGYAYESDTHFIHFYGKKPYYIISVGLTVAEKKNGTLLDWVQRRFGATDIKDMKIDVGHSIESIWRPSLYFWDDTCQAINISNNEQLSEESALRVLVQQLDNLLLYIEPSPDGLNCYSHKTRELLILACTEVENQWRAILEKAGCTPQNSRAFTTQDYSRIIGKVFLEEFTVKLRNMTFSDTLKPFEGWSVSSPTQSLVWYDGYNKTKHNREANFNCATLKHVIEAIAANIILYSVRFRPLSLINNTNNFSSLINQMFQIQMENSAIDSFYLPDIDTSKIARDGCFVFDSYKEGLNKPWLVDKLIL